jgi:hypothetical protein
MEFKPKHIEGLPYRKINNILKLKLSGNRVHLSKKAIAHIKDKHPDDYKVCFAGIEEAICSPDYIGQSPFHKANYELVKLTDKGNILVAMSSIADKYGYYPIESTYLLEKSTLMRRVRIKHLVEFK